MDKLEQGVRAQQAGRMAEAEQCYRAMLSINPNHAEAQYLLGMILVQRRQHQEGEKLLARAIALQPNQPGPHFQRGLALAGMQRLTEAASSFERAAALKPDYVEAHNSRGAVLGLLGRPDEALASFDRAIALRPDHAGVWVNRGIALMGQGRALEAIASFDRAIALRPGVPELFLLRGKARLGQGQAEAALADFDQLLGLQPGHGEALVGRAHALLLLDRAREGLAPVDKAVAEAPQLAEAWFTRGNIRSALGRPGEAIADYDRALHLKPGLVDAWLGRGNAHYAQRAFDAALADYDGAIAQKPDHADAHLNRGNALVALNAQLDALAAYGRVIALRPGDADAFKRRGNVFLTLGRLEEALADLRQARALDPNLPLVQSAIMAASLELCDWREFAADRDLLLVRVDEIAEGPFILFHVSDDAARQLACARNFAAHNFPPLSPPLWQGEIYHHPRIRLGYLSRTFRDHPTTILLGGLFAGHDRQHFETFGLSLSPDDGSAARHSLEKSFEHFIDLSAMGDQAAAEQIRALEIDILVDLDGFIEGSRTAIVARKPAPVQVSYLGYPGTMGAPYIDYVLADPVLAAPGDERHYAEQVVRLPDSYQPNSNRPEPGPTPTRAELGLPESGFVFASFNNNRKITPDLFDIWMRLLQQVPGSVLWLLAMTEPARKNLAREALARGVEPKRLIFAEIMRDQAAHLARQQAADLCLDTLFYNAHTTASDALWVGVPLVTCKGKSFASRVAASILCAAGLPDLVTHSLDAYEELALSLARDPARLKSLRDRLAQNRANCALFDSPRMLRHMESAFVRMAEITAKGEAPRGFDVARE